MKKVRSDSLTGSSRNKTEQHSGVSDKRATRRFHLRRFYYIHTPMSKTSLRKFLKDLNDQELQSLIMDVYSHSKDAKEYLDFLAEPDVAKKTEEYASRSCS